MRGKRLFLLVWILFLPMSQSCEANNRMNDAIEPTGQEEADSIRTSGMRVSEVRRAVYASSPYKPTGLLLYLDFEQGQVQPVSGQEARGARLNVKTPTGQSASFGITYEGGTRSDRFARIVSEPDNRDNRVLHYWIKNARVPGQKKGRYKGRIQMNLSGMNHASIFQRYRLYLHPDLDLYRRFPASNGWFTINELWMGARWKKHPFPFRLGVNIGKPEGSGKPLYFIASGDVSTGGPIGKGSWRSIWSKVAGNFEVPTGQWLDIEVGYKQGDDKSGRFYMGVKREQDRQFTTLFDLTNWTYHPDSPQPVGLTDWQPLKLYTASRIIDFVRQGGGVTQMFFDNLEIYADW